MLDESKQWHRFLKIKSVRATVVLFLAGIIVLVSLTLIQRSGPSWMDLITTESFGSAEASIRAQQCGSSPCIVQISAEEWRMIARAIGTRQESTDQVKRLYIPSVHIQFQTESGIEALVSLMYDLSNDYAEIGILVSGKSITYSNQDAVQLWYEVFLPKVSPGAFTSVLPFMC